MTNERTPASGSDTDFLVKVLTKQIDELKNAPPFKRAGLAARASETIVLALQDLDRRIQRLESGECDQQNDRHGNVPTVRRAGSGPQK